MFGFDGRCPRCSGARLWQSSRGLLRYPARMVMLYPLRCDHCQKRFWRFVWNPPPTVTRRRRSGSAVPVKPAGESDTPPGP
jgi:hypothetical protein